MRVRIRMVGSGTRDDPFRAELPTYSMVSSDEKNKIAIVDVPDRHGPPAFAEPASANTPLIDGKPTIIKLSPGELEAWQERLSKQYADHPRKFTANAD